jgi:hypothetical protein
MLGTTLTPWKVYSAGFHVAPADLQTIFIVRRIGGTFHNTLDISVTRYKTAVSGKVWVTWET